MCISSRCYVVHLELGYKYVIWMKHQMLTWVEGGGAEMTQNMLTSFLHDPQMGIAWGSWT